MNRIFILLVISLLISCDGVDKACQNCSQFEGTHLLRKFKVVSESGEKWGASYFLLGGSASGGTYVNNKISFSWQVSSGEYAISEIDLNRVRVKIDSTVTKPYVTFKLDEDVYYNRSIQDVMLLDVDYMIVHCREEDYPVNVQIDTL